MSPFIPKPDLPPPASSVGVIGWLRGNLFSSPLNSLLTLLALYLLYISLPPLIQWAFIDANWVGENRQDCSKDGACWVFIGVRLNQFIYGFYPDAEQWRVNTAFLLLAGLLVPLSLQRIRRKAALALLMVFGYPLIAWGLFYGGIFGLPLVQTHQWGGLMLTLVIAFVGIVLALPIGILLALGRRSEMPVIKAFCIIFIELWRGVPLITVLFMASVMLPLFFPEGVSLDKLLRALVGIVLFQSAYMAEVVRGGLQAIPKGQFEAAEALGLGYWKSMRLIVLPQALKLVIPGIVNTFIALFKDTTLVLIIGLLDFLSSVQTATTNPEWSIKSVPYTGYVLVALVFWVHCFGMAKYSHNLEQKLHTGHKR